jgi:hypothetical protein
MVQSRSILLRSERGQGQGRGGGGALSVKEGSLSCPLQPHDENDNTMVYLLSFVNVQSVLHSKFLVKTSFLFSRRSLRPSLMHLSFLIQ